MVTGRLGQVWAEEVCAAAGAWRNARQGSAAMMAAVSLMCTMCSSRF
jgi:hypothetical protein